MAIPRWVYVLAFVFLIFVIYNDPAGAGSMAHAFADFVGRLVSALGEFFSGLFGSDGGSSTSASNSSDLTVQPQVTVPSAPTTDYFIHGHEHGITDGLYHSHPDGYHYGDD